MEVEVYLYKNYPQKLRGKIVVLDISSRWLTGVCDLTSFPNLKYFICSHNKITSLILKNRYLEDITCDYNRIEKIPFEEAPNLKYLTCCNNKLTGSLIIEKNNNLKFLSIAGNFLNKLEIKSKKIKWLNTANNKISFLKINEAIALESLSCYGNLLTYVDFSNNSLNECYIYNNFFMPESLLTLSTKKLSHFSLDYSLEKKIEFYLNNHHINLKPVKLLQAYQKEIRNLIRIEQNYQIALKLILKKLNWDIILIIRKYYLTLDQRISLFEENYLASFNFEEINKESHFTNLKLIFSNW